MSTTVTTQAELDKALTTEHDLIVIDSPRGVWLHLSASGSATVKAYDSATVKASGSTTVEASGSTTVEASGSATVKAYDSATVRASDSTTVKAYDSATVRAYDSATVEAYGSATVRASDSATVRAYDSATVRAYDSATVEAYGSATVRASDSATVEASKYVAVHLHSTRVTLTGGVVIDLTTLDLNTMPDWIDYHGITRDGDTLTVYKAVDDNLDAGHSHKITQYPLGGTVTAPDWQATPECGHGLHFGYTPTMAKRYFTSATRYLECAVAVAECVALGDKIKAKSCTVVREVTIDGEPVIA